MGTEPVVSEVSIILRVYERICSYTSFGRFIGRTLRAQEESLIFLITLVRVSSGKESFDENVLV